MEAFQEAEKRGEVFYFDTDEQARAFADEDKRYLDKEKEAHYSSNKEMCQKLIYSKPSHTEDGKFATIQVSPYHLDDNFGESASEYYNIPTASSDLIEFQKHLLFFFQ